MPAGRDALGLWRSPGGAKGPWFKDPDGNTPSLTERGAGSERAFLALRR